jgi:hypothetical protein
VKEASLSSEQRFLNSLENGTEYSSDELFRAYRAFCDVQALPSCQNSLTLGRRLVPYYGTHLNKVKGRDANNYVVNKR